MSKRLEVLKKMMAAGSTDPFVPYALALEYSGSGQIEDALQTFSSLRDAQPGYVPMYLMCGSMLVKAGRLDEAREWLSAGAQVARAKGDTHALGELETALAEVGVSGAAG
jgi:predicted Zn-dependent protease